MEKHKFTPTRPSSVPADAVYMDWNNSSRVEAHWVISEYDTEKKQYVGDYIEWDTNGNLLAKRKYDRITGAQLERNEYFNGHITESRWYVGEELFEDHYYYHIYPPVVNVSSVYHKHNNDRQKTIFDKTGRQLYSVREELVTVRHQRRYYNGILVYEGIQHEDESKAPLYVRYFYPNGATLIDYSSNNDGTGIWRLYDESAQEIHNLPETDERGRNVDMDWDEFIPTWFNYGEEEHHMPDWDAARAKFIESYNDLLISNTIATLNAPAHLQVELDKIDWNNIKTSHMRGNDLPPAITGILSEDEDVAAESTNRIWYEIEYDRTLYEAIFPVGIVVARMLPFYLEVPVVRQRIVKFLFKVLSQPHIKVEWERYEELIASFEPLLPLLFQWAGEPDLVTAQHVQYILLHAARELITGSRNMQR
ncbi:MAG TPA: hypothetical protein VIM79_03125 [Niastella sp.]